MDWNLDLFFHRDLAQLNVERTRRVTLAHFESGQEIIRQGDPADAFYVIVRGEVAVIRGTQGEESSWRACGGVTPSERLA